MVDAHIKYKVDTHTVHPLDGMGTACGGDRHSKRLVRAVRVAQPLLVQIAVRQDSIKQNTSHKKHETYGFNWATAVGLVERALVYILQSTAVGCRI